MNTKSIAVTLSAVGVFAVPGVSVHASQELAQQKGCLACHAADKKLVGPAFSEIATKYAGEKDAEATLAASIKKGGSGKWGSIPMPPQAALSEADAKTLSKWVLAAKK